MAKKKSEQKVEMSDMVLIRTYSAGIHFGKLVRRDGKEVELVDARRLWSWEGACSLSQVAMDGVGKDSRISVPVPSVILTEAIEIIQMTQRAVKNMTEEIEPWKI